MDAILKFLSKLQPKVRERLESVISDIAQNRLKELDIKPLKGYKGWYRCRVGDIRIIFVKNSGANILIEIGFRGDMYKK